MRKAGNFYHKIYWKIIRLSRSGFVFRKLIDWAALIFYKVFRGSKEFKFEGKRYRYFYHLYNRTVASERVIEIPIAKELVDKYQGKSILEVGNVLAHYFDIKHEVLDKYEEGKDVINQDVVKYSPRKKYDLIISISTMEHVGWSYGENKDVFKFKKGIRNLKGLLKKEGLLFVTFPLFYRDDLTELIERGKAGFSGSYFLYRTSFWNEWKQCSKKEAFLRNSAYDSFYANANVLFIGTYNNG